MKMTYFLVEKNKSSGLLINLNFSFHKTFSLMFSAYLVVGLFPLSAFQNSQLIHLSLCPVWGKSQLSVRALH